MALSEVIEKDWTPGPKKAAPATGARAKSGGKAGGKAARGRGKARGRGLGIRRNPALEKVRRAPAKGKGRLRWVPKGSVQANESNAGGKAGGKMGGKARGKAGGRGRASEGWGSKGGGKAAQGRKGGFSEPRGPVRRLWRGAKAAETNADRRAAKGGGKQRQWDPRRVNRAGMISKRSQKGKGKASSWKGGGKALAISNGSGYGKGKGNSKGNNKGSSKGSSKGKGYGGGGSWGQERDDRDRRDSWSSFEPAKGGGRGRGEDWRAADHLTAEDKRMMKKITIVAQLDKVPRPHPAMQGMVRSNGKRSGGGDTGALSSRFAANFTR